MQDDMISATLIDKETLNNALKEYMISVQGLDDTDILFVLSDFEDIYTCPWLRQEYVEDRVIDGVKYEVDACWTDFSMFQTFTDEERFQFYMLIHLKNPNDMTVKAYREAEKRYILEPLSEEDFPDF